MCGFIITLDQNVNDDLFSRAVSSLSHRGPDDMRNLKVPGAQLGFTRLAVMDLSSHGDQPFEHDGKYYLCNGEIYNYEDLKKEFPFAYKSSSDCEVLIPLFENQGIPELLRKLDGEFAFVIYDREAKQVFAARDPIGIRPLFYGYTESGEISFASEVKALQEFCRDIKPFPPGHYFHSGEVMSYIDVTHVASYSDLNLVDTCSEINRLFTQSVVKRLKSDAPMGFLLSGGLDSSLVCSIAQKFSKKPIRTFSIGMDEDAIDLKYAREVADFIGSDHTEVIINKEDVLSSIKQVIFHLESYDITTVRASIGMFLVCQYIKQHTDIKVLLTGEVSDEIFGYKYTDFAPNAGAFQEEAAKRVRELYMYDVLRADRCIAAHSLEARVPFSDTDFVRFVMAINPEMKMNQYGHGKYLLRKAFEGDYLPESILYREKAAFSDAVGHSLVDHIKEYAEAIYTQSHFEAATAKYGHATPFTKESLLYRELFEELYPGKSKLISGFWMPNNKWDNCDVEDPSARVLPNYGASGS